MQIIDAHILANFAKRHADARRPLQEWIDAITELKYATSRDIKNRWVNASFLSGDRVIFNIKGNDYRLLTVIDYFGQKIKVLRIGTHQEYDKWKL